MIYITSDTHFCHNNIIEYDERPFNNIEEMNDVIINNWNAKVKDSDIVYHLGDFGLGSTERLKSIYNQLNGSITLVRGNHDYSLTKLMEIGFDSIVDSITLKYKGYILKMNHYPDFSNDNQENILNIHGHTHSEHRFKDNLINLSCNAWNYEPVRLDDLISIYRKNNKK